MNRSLPSTLIALACLGLGTAHAGAPTKLSQGQRFVAMHLKPTRMTPQLARFGSVVAAHIDARGGFYRSGSVEPSMENRFEYEYLLRRISSAGGVAAQDRKLVASMSAVSDEGKQLLHAFDAVHAWQSPVKSGLANLRYTLGGLARRDQQIRAGVYLSTGLPWYATLTR